MKTEHLVYDFTTIAINSGGWMILDREFIQNKIMQLIGVTLIPVPSEQAGITLSSTKLCLELVKVAREKNEMTNADELFSKLMELTTPPPSVVNAMFAKHYDSSPKEALDYFKLLNVTNGFILNTTDTEALKPSPICPLCFNHEGIDEGRCSELPLVRRFIRLNLEGESYGFQLKRIASVIGDGLFFKEQHELVRVTTQTVSKVCQLLDLFSEYCITLDEEFEKNGHGYLSASRKQPIDKEEVYSLSLPFFKQTKFSLQKNQLSLLSSSYTELPLVFDYLLALSQNQKELTSAYQFKFTKNDQGYQVSFELKEDNQKDVLQHVNNWLNQIKMEMEEIV